MDSVSDHKIGVLVLMVLFVLSGATSREVSKKLQIDIKVIALLMGVLYAYILSHYDLEDALIDQIVKIVPEINELAVSSFLITASYRIDYKK